MQPTPFFWENIQNQTPVKGNLGSLVVEPVQNDDEKDLCSQVLPIPRKISRYSLSMALMFCY